MSKVTEILSDIEYLKGIRTLIINRMIEKKIKIYYCGIK